METQKIVIIGGGFGGLTVAKALKKSAVEIVLYDKTNHHLFQPLLYQVATSALSPADVAQPIREILRDQQNCTVFMADVDAIDKENKQIILRSGNKVSYDVLVVAVGGTHSYFGNDQWEEFAPGLKTLRDALGIRESILMAFEKAERCESNVDALTYLNFIIIGGGPTGVELAGAIAEIASHSMIKNFRKINPEQAKIFLLEGSPQILPAYPVDLSQAAQKALEKLGVHVMTNTIVTNVVSNGVWIGDNFLPAHNIIWAAGNQASPLLKTLNVPLDRQGRVIVENDLSIPGHPEVFVIGDAAHFKGKNGQPLPGIAPSAIQEAKYVAKIIKNKVPPESRKPFVYFDKGQMATIGKAKAIAMVGKVKMKGFMAWMAWSVIHIFYLVSFKNRVMVMMEWLFWFITGHRNVRLIVNTYQKHAQDQKVPPKDQ